MRTAAYALDQRLLTTPLDACHAADAFHREEPLHTADDEPLAAPFPTQPF